MQQHPLNKKVKNPRDKDGNVSSSAVCDSIINWFQHYPGIPNHNKYYSNEILLYQADYGNPSNLL